MKLESEHGWEGSYLNGERKGKKIIKEGDRLRVIQQQGDSIRKGDEIGVEEGRIRKST